MQERDGPYKEYSKTFLATETYRNLKVTIHGFFAYASSVFDIAPTVRYIPLLHANQSTIENVFSQIRAMHRDSALSFQKARLAQQLRVNTPALVKNKMYDPDHIGDQDVKLNRLEEVLGIKDEIRDKETRRHCLQVSATANMLHPPKHNDSAAFVYENGEKVARFGVLDCDLGKHEQMAVTLVQLDEPAPNFLAVLISDREFWEIAKIGRTGPAQRWFDTVLLLSGMDLLVFDKLCQRINCSILAIFVQMMEDGGHLKAHRDQSTYHKRFLDYLYTGVDTALAEAATAKPELGCRMAICVLAQVLNRRFLLAIRTGLTKQQENGSVARTPSSEMIIDDVQKIFGWAIFSLREGRKSILSDATSKTDADKVVIIESELDFLADMRRFHHEIVADQDYIKNCYPTRRLLQDRGFLTLVSPTFFGFGKELIKFVCLHFTAKRISTEGSAHAKKAMSELCIENKALKTTFLSSAAPCRVLSEREKVKIYEELISKVAHSRVGEVMRAYRNDKLVKGKKHASKGRFRANLHAKSGSHDVGKTIKTGCDETKKGTKRKGTPTKQSDNRKAPPR